MQRGGAQPLTCQFVTTCPALSHKKPDPVPCGTCTWCAPETLSGLNYAGGVFHAAHAPLRGEVTEQLAMVAAGWTDLHWVEPQRPSPGVNEGRDVHDALPGRLLHA